MEKISRVIIMGIFFFLLTSCYKEESYESKREPTEIVEVIPEKEEAAVTEKVTSEQVNLRAEASVDSAVLSQVAKGTAVEVLSTENVGDVSWSRIIIENSVGYIQSQYIIDSE